MMRQRTLLQLLLTLSAVLLFLNLCHVSGVAHAQAAGTTSAAVVTADAGWQMVTDYGPFLGAVLILYGFGSAFLRRNQSSHWIAQGRTLSAITGGITVIGAVLEWRLGGGSAAGVLVALYAAISLVTHSTTVNPSTESRTTPGVGPTIVSLLLIVSLASCGGPSRQDTIRGAELTLNAARDGLLIYNHVHEDKISHSGPATSEGAAAAAAKLKAYRDKRAVFDKALVAAYDAVLVALTLNDQPSLDGLTKAIALVLANYQALKGATP